MVHSERPERPEHAARGPRTRRRQLVDATVVVAVLGLLTAVVTNWDRLTGRKPGSRVVASEGPIAEPSGLTASAIVDGATGDTLLLAVDDEQGAVFTLRAPDSAAAPAGRRFPLPVEAKDLEDVTWDGTVGYYAITSHRTLDTAGSRKNQRRLIRFAFPADARTAGAVLTGRAWDLAPALRAFLDSVGVPVDAGWATETGARAHPYALEIEGLAYRDGALLVGLKWPLVHGKAVLLTYAPEHERFTAWDTLDLGGHGITALAFVAPDRLAVATNPPQQPQNKMDRSDPAFSRSVIRAYDVAPRTTRVGREVGRRDVPFVGAKLEGLATAGRDLILAYDGVEPRVRRLGRPAVDSLLGRAP